MKKSITSFVCQECGYDTPSWYGKCPECGAWNSLKEFQVQSAKRTGQNPVQSLGVGDGKAKTLKEIVYTEKSKIQTEYEELNTVLGGGIVRGAVMLIAGDPGVGKSTLLLQLALSLAMGKSAEVGFENISVPQSSRANAHVVDERNVARRGVNKKISKTSPRSNQGQIEPKIVLYVSGEESVEQIKMRAERISSAQLQKQTSEKRKGNAPLRSSTSAQATDNLLLISLTDADAIVQHIENIKPDLVIVDSIQTIESQNVSGLSGSVGQVRYGALQFVRVAKQHNIPIVIVGHVTKEGMVAGPMVLSHMVDTVLFLEGEKFAKTRILRSLKNRFGPVDEVGIFLMEEEGMSEAKNPEQLFLSTDRAQTPGSVLVATLEGSRAFLVELQALVVSTKFPMPRRIVSGCDQRRVELLLAVLQKHCRLPVDTMDVFVNVAGGLRLSDPAIDLGICLAVYSSLRNVAINQTVGIAEVGLLGELRVVAGLEKRVREAKKLGFKQVITAKTHKTLSDVIKEFGK